MYNFFILISLLFCSILSATDVKGTLHALLICDTLAPQLKEAYLIDLQRMKEKVENIAVKSKLKLDLNVFTDKQVTRKNVEKWISHLDVKAKEVVLVYYVGRQDIHAKVKGCWPALKAAKSKSINAPGIAKQVLKHKPKLALIFFDCYDRIIYVPQGEEPPVYCAKSSKNRSHFFIHPLFMRSKGLYMACSCSIGQKSLGTRCEKTIGGIFTTNLIKFFSLAQYLHKNVSPAIRVKRGEP